jgi:phosphatidate cytidylyltransferase
MTGTGYSPAKSLALGVTAALVGTFGDLVESKFKRWVGVKDSAALAITNGMGGLLDMFDSLLFAPAVIYILMGLKF